MAEKPEFTKATANIDLGRMFNRTYAAAVKLGM
jgi:hypothetical protein